MFNTADDKIRLFLALWPDKTVRQYISEDTEAAVIASGGKPVPPRNFHVTLAFLGSVRQTSLDDIIRAMRTVRFGSFDLVLDSLGYFAKARTAWLGPSEQNIALDALVENIWDKLENLGFAREFHTYKPHVSLCRKVDQGLELTLYDPIRWSVDAFALVHSVPGPDGSTYTVLEQFAAGN